MKCFIHFLAKVLAAKVAATSHALVLRIKETNMFNRKLAFLAFLLHSFSVSYCNRKYL